MSQPPNRQKENQEHAIDTIQTKKMTTFQIPATTFEILKGRLDTPAQTVLVNALAACRLIRNDQEGFFFAWLPTGTEIGLNLIVLPETNFPIKPLPRRVYEIRDRTSWQKTICLGPMLTGMLCTDTEQIMPAIVLTERDHRKTTEGPISDQSTFLFSNIITQTLE